MDSLKVTWSGDGNEETVFLVVKNDLATTIRKTRFPERQHFYLLLIDVCYIGILSKPNFAQPAAL